MKIVIFYEDPPVQDLSEALRGRKLFRIFVTNPPHRKPRRERRHLSQPGVEMFRPSYYTGLSDFHGSWCERYRFMSVSTVLLYDNSKTF